MENQNSSIENRTEEHEGKYIWRFEPFLSFLHILVVISFLALAFTGMTIKFSGVGAFQVASQIMGGYEVTGYIHRIAAIITFGYFALHIGYLIKKVAKQKKSLKYMLSGENSMVPNKRDLKELIGTFKWFFGVGKRPDYGRWTYWEKFDYFAVFWGVAVIGFSGLILWFPEFFTALGLPGWLINVATIVHSDEALLATGFIFTVHFFNTHFRPDKFPMDNVIFTGRVPLEEFKKDRPREYQQLVEEGKLEERFAPPPPEWLKKFAKIFGFTALTLGLLIVVLIIYSMIFLYR